MKKAKKTDEKKPEKCVRIVWKIREVSRDGLLKVPEQSEWGSKSNTFDECCGYSSPEEAATAILEKEKEDSWFNSNDLVAIPFFKIYTEEKVDE